MAYYRLIPAQNANAATLLEALTKRDLAAGNAHIIGKSDLYPEHVAVRQDEQEGKLDALIKSLSICKNPLIGKHLKAPTTPTRSPAHVSRNSARFNAACVLA
jgi:hypothetical protein